jgi:hypothetical protein
MPNGTIGDHPYTDIVDHERRVYSAHVNELVLELDDRPSRFNSVAPRGS